MFIMGPFVDPSLVRVGKLSAASLACLGVNLLFWKLGLPALLLEQVPGGDAVDALEVTCSQQGLKEQARSPQSDRKRDRGAQSTSVIGFGPQSCFSPVPAGRGAGRAAPLDTVGAWGMQRA